MGTEPFSASGRPNRVTSTWMLGLLALFTVLALVGSGCSRPEAPPRSTRATETASGQVPPTESAQQCQVVDVDVAQDGAGHSSREAAFAAFARREVGLQDARLDGSAIRVNGEQIGVVHIGTTGGGFYVAGAEWCPSPEVWKAQP